MENQRLQHSWTVAILQNQPKAETSPTNEVNAEEQKIVWIQIRISLKGRSQKYHLIITLLIEDMDTSFTPDVKSICYQYQSRCIPHDHLSPVHTHKVHQCLWSEISISLQPHVCKHAEEGRRSKSRDTVTATHGFLVNRQNHCKEHQDCVPIAILP